MKRSTGILLLLFCIALLSACNNSSSNKPDSKKETPGDTTIIRPVSNYHLDTASVLNNERLPSLLEELKKDNIITHINKKEIPAFIISFLEGLKKDSFSIANPGEEWQAGDVIMEPLPARQLVYFGIGEHTALLTHYTGGIATAYHVLLFKFSNNEVTDFWCGGLPYDIKEKEAIINYLDKNKENKSVLNGNYIYF